jgi:hypothetical protein
MRTFRVSDQMYEQLKSFIVDPFDDTPELVIGRLIEIVNKAKARWAPRPRGTGGAGASAGCRPLKRSRRKSRVVFLSYPRSPSTSPSVAGLPPTAATGGG